MKYISAIFLSLILASSNLASEPIKGSICIPSLPGSSGSLPELPMTREYISPNSTLLIQVDKRKPITVSSLSGGSIKDLSLKRKHLIKIRQNGKIVVSFWFSFEKEGAKDLCLWYYKGYGTFSLKPAIECKCSELKTNNDD